MNKIKSVWDALTKPVIDTKYPSTCIEDHIKQFKIFLRNHTNLIKYHLNEKFNKNKMTCPLRMVQDGPWKHAENLDWWDKAKKDRTCSFCGSWHPKEFLEFLNDVIEEEGRTGLVELNDRKDKVYIYRESVINADFGAIKFKLAHLPPKMITPANNDLFNRAIKISKTIFHSRLQKTS